MVRLLVSFLVFLLFFYQPKAQIKNPLSWIKKGLVVVYEYEGGAGGEFGTRMGSAVYGKGYQIYVILEKEYNNIYGTLYTLLSSYTSGTFTTGELKQLGNLSNGGQFFVNPIVTDREIREKKTPPGCKVEGNPGSYILECNLQGVIRKTMLTYDRKSGLVKELITMEYSTRRYGPGSSSTTAKAKYLTHFYVDLPSVEEFPPVAFKSSTYRIITNTPMGSMVTGTLNINFKSRTNKVAHYQIFMPNAPMPSDVIGLPVMGPHYVHPSLLRKKVILDIPQAYFRVVTNGTGYKGGIVLQAIWQGNVVMQQEFDQNTGIKLFEYYPQYMGGFSISFELVQ